MTSSEPSSLELHNVGVTLHDCELLHGVGFTVLPGELCAVLGATGAGKSTLLRAIAGFDPLATGGIRLDDADISRRAAHKRGIAMMQQDFPLWPNLTVGDNVAFGLKRLGLAKAEVGTYVERGLAFVGLADFRRHLPWQLSPGQRQRVALARTLVAGARVNLLDEPFSALDSRLRARLLQIVRAQQRHSRTTTLLTTSDPDAALRVADRIVVLHEGELLQAGTPAELYDAPLSRQVAEYLGAANLIEGQIEYTGDQPLFRGDSGLVIPLFEQGARRPRAATVMFRPHQLYPLDGGVEADDDLVRYTALVEGSELLGGAFRYTVDLDGTRVVVDLPRVTGEAALTAGKHLVFGLDPAEIRILER